MAADDALLHHIKLAVVDHLFLGDVPGDGFVLDLDGSHVLGCRLGILWFRGRRFRLLRLLVAVFKGLFDLLAGLFERLDRVARRAGDLLLDDDGGRNDGSRGRLGAARIEFGDGRRGGRNHRFGDHGADGWPRMQTLDHTA